MNENQNLTSTFISAGGAKLRAVHGGDGDAVIFLHAGVADRRMWLAHLDELCARYFVVAYDRRGFGETTTPDESFRHVDDLRAVIQHFGLERVTLVGCSQGGRIAVDFALAHPKLVCGLSLVAPALSGDDVEFAHPDEVLQLQAQMEACEENEDVEGLNALEAWAWLDGPLEVERRVTGSARDLFLDMNRIALLHAELSKEEEPPLAATRLGELAVPVQLCWGARDFPHVIDRCKRMARAIPHSSVHVIADAAHLIPLEQPERFRDILHSFLT